jgi:large subunit ribosomal protein L6
MKKEIQIPEKVEVKIDGKIVTVKGPKAELSKKFSFPLIDREITIGQKDGKIEVSTTSDKKKALAMVGTIAAHMKNMFAGTLDGYKYELSVIYTHFPISVTEKDKLIEVKNFLGEKGLRRAKVVGECKVDIEKDKITVHGADVEHVGQTAANIERSCKLRGRDRRIFQDGIFLSHRRLESGKEI